MTAEVELKVLAQNTFKKFFCINGERVVIRVDEEYLAVEK